MTIECPVNYDIHADVHTKVLLGVNLDEEGDLVLTLFVKRIKMSS